MIRAPDHSSIISSVSLVLHHMHQLLLRQSVADGLLLVVEDRGRLAEFFRYFALGTR